MPQLRDKEAERLFHVLEKAGYVSWPEDTAEPVVLIDEIASRVRRAGQREIKPVRILRLLFGREDGWYVSPIEGREVVAIANALNIDALELLYDAPPKRNRPKSLLDGL